MLLDIGFAILSLVFCVVFGSLAVIFTAGIVGGVCVGIKAFVCFVIDAVRPVAPETPETDEERKARWMMYAEEARRMNAEEARRDEERRDEQNAAADDWQQYLEENWKYPRC